MSGDGIVGFDLLRLEGFLTASFEEIDKVLYVDAVLASPEEPTCECDDPDVVRHGKRLVQFRDCPIQRQETYLRINRQRYRCRSCRSLLLEELPGIDDKRRMTVRFLKQMADDGINMKFAMGGTVNGVKESLVRRVFKDEARARLANYTFDLPRVLGMDEKVLGGKARFVIGDVENKVLLDITESRKKLDLEAYFKKWHHLDRAKVEVITQDMYWNYKTLNEQYFRRATIVVDRFHVVRFADWAVSEIRRNIQARADDDERIDLKRNMEVLQKGPNKLTGEDKVVLHRIFKRHPKLEEAYTLKEWFYKIYHCKTREEAERDYEAWREMIPADMKHAFGPIFSFMREKRWRRFIFNFFDHRYTNGYVEAVNGLLDEISRGGRGYDLETLRAKALLKYGKVQPLADRYAFDWAGLTEAQRFELLTTNVGHGVDLSTFERDLREGSFW